MTQMMVKMIFRHTWSAFNNLLSLESRGVKGKSAVVYELPVSVQKEDDDKQEIVRELPVSVQKEDDDKQEIVRELPVSAQKEDDDNQEIVRELPAQTKDDGKKEMVRESPVQKKDDRDKGTVRELPVQKKDERMKGIVDDHQEKHGDNPGGCAIRDVSPVHTKYRYVPDRSEMKNVFDRFDENGDGVICAEDLRLFTHRLGFEMSDEEVRRMLKTVDRNSDDFLDFEEFFSAYSSLSGTGSDKTDERGEVSAREEEEEEEGSLLEAFYVFDHNKDGLISALELQKVLLNLGMPEGKSLKSCQRMIEKFDTDGNGQVDFNEFKVMMCSDAFQL